MTIVNPDGPLDPDWLRGEDLDLAVELFRDVDWRDEEAVEQRIAQLDEWKAAVAASAREPGDPRDLY